MEVIVAAAIGVIVGYMVRSYYVYQWYEEQQNDILARHWYHKDIADGFQKGLDRAQEEQGSTPSKGV
jgi:hypothetical protein